MISVTPRAPSETGQIGRDESNPHETGLPTSIGSIRRCRVPHRQV